MLILGSILLIRGSTLLILGQICWFWSTKWAFILLFMLTNFVNNADLFLVIFSFLVNGTNVDKFCQLYRLVVQNVYSVDQNIIDFYQPTWGFWCKLWWFLGKFCRLGIPHCWFRVRYDDSYQQNGLLYFFLCWQILSIIQICSLFFCCTECIFCWSHRISIRNRW